MLPRALPLYSLLLLLACGSAEPLGAQPRATQIPPPAPGLPPLGGQLLERQDLQAIANLQQRRDTVGLLMRLNDDDAAIRARAALAFGSVRSPTGAPALYPLLEDPDPSVRAFAAFGIGQSGQVLSIPVLIDALHREAEPAVLIQLMDALGRVGDRPALGALMSRELPAGLEASRAIAVARFGMRGVHDLAAVDWLARQLQEPDARLRQSAAYYFARISEPSPWRDHSPAVVDAAQRLSVDDPAQLHLATALGRLAAVEHEPLVVRLLRGSSDWRIRANAARALGEWRSAQGTAALLGALDDAAHHVAVAAAGALARGALAEDQLDLLEAWLATRPDEWQVWSAFLPALVAAGRLGVVEDLLGRDLPVAARAAVVRALGAGAGEGERRLLAKATTHPEPRVAAAAVEALRARWGREPDRAAVADMYLRAFSGALRRGHGAVVHAAAPALADTTFLRMGAGEALRAVYHELSTTGNVGAKEAIIRAHAATRDTAALDFLVGQAVEARHPVLRQASVETLTARFGEGFHFTTLGGSPPRFAPLDWAYLRSLGERPRLVLETTRGTILLELFTEWAPATVQAITRFAREGRYDGIPFHRVVPNFVIQGGDVGSGDGFGGPGFFLPSEFTPIPYLTGMLGMASLGPDTEGSQFFITHSEQPHLDGNYTVFGRVTGGQSVVDAIRAEDRVVRARVEPSR